MKQLQFKSQHDALLASQLLNEQINHPHRRDFNRGTDAGVKAVETPTGLEYIVEVSNIGRDEKNRIAELADIVKVEVGKSVQLENTPQSKKYYGHSVAFDKQGHFKSKFQQDNLYKDKAQLQALLEMEGLRVQVKEVLPNGNSYNREGVEGLMLFSITGVETAEERKAVEKVAEKFIALHSSNDVTQGKKETLSNPEVKAPQKIPSRGAAATLTPGN